MARRTFTKADRTAFAALPIGAAIEWRNGAHWWPGVKAGQITEDSIGIQHFMIRNLATTRTIGAGQHYGAYPGSVRPVVEGTVTGTGAGHGRVKVRDGRWTPE